MGPRAHACAGGPSGANIRCNNPAGRTSGSQSPTLCSGVSCDDVMFHSDTLSLRSDANRRHRFLSGNRVQAIGRLAEFWMSHNGACRVCECEAKQVWAHSLTLTSESAGFLPELPPRRPLLSVPSHSDRKVRKAAGLGADVASLYPEDAVAASRKAAACRDTSAHRCLLPCPVQTRSAVSRTTASLPLQVLAEMMFWRSERAVRVNSVPLSIAPSGQEPAALCGPARREQRGGRVRDGCGCSLDTVSSPMHQAPAVKRMVVA